MYNGRRIRLIQRTGAGKQQFGRGVTEFVDKKYLSPFSEIKYDFSKLTGVKINPQTVYQKDLSYSYLKKVVFIGPFDGVNVENTIFEFS